MNGLKGWIPFALILSYGVAGTGVFAADATVSLPVATISQRISTTNPHMLPTNPSTVPLPCVNNAFYTHQEISKKIPEGILPGFLRHCNEVLYGKRGADSDLQLKPNALTYMTLPLTPPRTIKNGANNITIPEDKGMLTQLKKTFQNSVDVLYDAGKVVSTCAEDPMVQGVGTAPKTITTGIGALNQAKGFYYGPSVCNPIAGIFNGNQVEGDPGIPVASLKTFHAVDPKNHLGKSCGKAAQIRVGLQRKSTKCPDHWKCSKKGCWIVFKSVCSGFNAQLWPEFSNDAEGPNALEYGAREGAYTRGAWIQSLNYHWTKIQNEIIQNQQIVTTPDCKDLAKMNREYYVEALIAAKAIQYDLSGGFSAYTDNQGLDATIKKQQNIADIWQCRPMDTTTDYGASYRPRMSSMHLCAARTNLEIMFQDLVQCEVSMRAVRDYKEFLKGKSGGSGSYAKSAQEHFIEDSFNSCKVRCQGPCTGGNTAAWSCNNSSCDFAEACMGNGDSPRGCIQNCYEDELFKLATDRINYFWPAIAPVPGSI